MSNPIYIPMAGIGHGIKVSIGPGTQALADDMPILDLPSGDMSVFQQPILPEPEDVADLDAAKHVLEQALQALLSYRVGEATRSIELDHLDAANLALVNQAMGEGEVSITCAGDAPVVAQESVLAGLWRVQHLDRHGQLLHDCLEVANIPHFVAPAPAAPRRIQLDEIPAGASNAPSLLVELDQQQQCWQPGEPAHVINLTLLPVSEQELLLIGARLGVGAVTILSRGYGNCRIGSTAFQNVWWIKYFNSEDRLILNSIEVCDIPEVAVAAQEDIDDSAARLDEILSLYR